jgi:ornithine cyclodeaminase/alanine dehydrogenase-like protein (mu-crystallin family)
VKEYQGITLFMPAYFPELESLGAKIVSVFPENIKSGLPTIHAIVIISDSKTGRSTALMDGTDLTALRISSVSGVATGLLARKRSKTTAIIGAGIQDRTQLEAICCVRDIQKVWVYDINPQIAESFSEEMQNRRKPIPRDISAVSSSQKAVSDADIVSAATTSSIPVFEDTHLKPGAHINGIGSYTPEMEEIPEKTILRSKVVVDSITASLEEADDLIIPLRKGLIDKSTVTACFKSAPI